MDEKFKEILFIIALALIGIWQKYRESQKKESSQQPNQLKALTEREAKQKAYQDFLKGWTEDERQTAPVPPPLPAKAKRELADKNEWKDEWKDELIANKQRPPKIPPPPIVPEQFHAKLYQQSEVQLQADQAYALPKNNSQDPDNAYVIQERQTISKASLTLALLEKKREMLLFKEILAPPLALRNYDE